MYVYVIACSVVLDVRCTFMFFIVHCFKAQLYALSLFRGYECQMYIVYIFVLTFFIGFQLHKECLTCTMAITFSISRCQISIYVVTLFSVMNARCTLLCLSCSMLIAVK
jgi:general stress protein CsbA